MADLFQDILKTFSKLGLFEDGVELIGSWSYLLYQRHLGVKRYPLRTQDIDFLLPRPYPKRKTVDLGKALEKLGFRVDFTQSGVVYFLHPELKIEFLVPERGRGEEQALNVKPLGVNAIPLRFLDILLKDSIVVKEGSIKVRIPNPLNYCLQKLIVAQRRKNPLKIEKDLEQASAVLGIITPEEFQAELKAYPKGWKSLVEKSLQKAHDMFPLQRPTLEKFITLQK